MSEGRFTLGLGAGWFEEEHRLFGIPFPRKRFDLLEEALSFIAAGLNGCGFRGNYFEIASFDARPRPRRLRIAIGGAGPRRTPELAGRFADEYNVYFGPLEEMSYKIGVARQAAAHAGRDPLGLLISTTAPIITGTTAERFREALSAASRVLGRAPHDIEQAFRERGIPVGPKVSLDLGALEEIGVGRLYIRLFDTDPVRRNDTLAALVG